MLYLEFSMDRIVSCWAHGVAIAEEGDKKFFFFKQKTTYEIGTGDCSSDVCSSDLTSCTAKAGRCFWAPPLCNTHLMHSKSRALLDRKSVVEGKSVALGVRRIIKKKREDRSSIHTNITGTTLPALSFTN